MGGTMSVGDKNAYWCPECHGYVVTIDVDQGVTPMFLACRAKGEPSNPLNDCTGQMHSMMYPEEPWPDEDGYGDRIPTEPTWEWYRPTSIADRVRHAAVAGAYARPGRPRRHRQLTETEEHVAKGGLLLRPRETP